MELDEHGQPLEGLSHYLVYVTALYDRVEEGDEKVDVELFGRYLDAESQVVSESFGTATVTITEPEREPGKAEVDQTPDQDCSCPCEVVCPSGDA